MGVGIHAVIDFAALKLNYFALKKTAAGARVLAVVKANAYGHGLENVALALRDADGFGVARLDEALCIRRAGVTGKIVLLEGAACQEEMNEASAHSLDVVIHHAAQIEFLRNVRPSEKAGVWLKIDTGMNRLGFRFDDVPEAVERLIATVGRSQQVYLMTHLSSADSVQSMVTPQQAERFANAIKQIDWNRYTSSRPERSVCNSAGLLAWPSLSFDWVRSGIALYGVSPFPDRRPEDFGLTPVMTLKSSVIAIRTVPRGESVGYSQSWTSKRHSRIAIVAGGYGDGLPRNAGTKACVSFGSRMAPIVGRVSMDMMTVDVTDIPEIHIGDDVEFWGAKVLVSDAAKCANTIPYELLCGISNRVPTLKLT